MANNLKFLFAEGLYLELTLLKPSFVRLFWGADIEVFYKEIQQSWDVLSKRIQEGTFLGPKKTEVTSYTEKYLLFNITFVLKNKDYHLYYTYNVYVYCFRVYDSFSNLYEFLWQFSFNFLFLMKFDTCTICDHFMPI